MLMVQIWHLLVVKRIFYNKADTRAGRKDMLGHALESGKFNCAGEGNTGYARVGLSETQVYYDWYEYKIPAGDSDLYSFQIKDLIILMPHLLLNRFIRYGAMYG